MYNFQLLKLLVATLMVCAYSACKKTDYATLHFESLYQGHLFGNGKEEMQYPGYILDNQEAYGAILKQINSVNPSTGQELYGITIDWEKECIVWLVDSVRETAVADINLGFVDVYNKVFKAYFKIHTVAEKPAVAIRQAFNVIKVEKAVFEKAQLERMN
jgi:hypothetical protein